MDNWVFAADLYDFLKSHDALGHLKNKTAEDSIAELKDNISDIDMINETIYSIEEIADGIDDPSVYARDVKPLVRALLLMRDNLENVQSRRLIADTGFEVKQSIHLGDREIILAENMNNPDGQFYMKAEYMNNGLIGQYDRIIYSPSYLAVMEEFIASAGRQLASLRKELTDFDSRPFPPDKCHPHDYSQDITGRVVAIKATALKPEYRRADAQLVYVTGGFGAKANARGSAVFCYHLSDGEQTRFERGDILGVVRELPAWARERLAVLQATREPERQTAREKVAGYEITERLQVGQKHFVLGENPAAPSPFATWQHVEGRSGYDWGHYFASRSEALTDLHKRADTEREHLAADKGNKRDTRDGAR